MNTKKGTNYSSETRNTRQNRLISNRQILTNQQFAPQSNRGNTLLISPQGKIMISSLKIDEKAFKLETEQFHRSNTYNTQRGKLPEINSPIHIHDPPESCRVKNKFVFPPTCIKKIKETNTVIQTESSLPVSHNDFRRSLNFQKKSIIDKQDRPRLVTKRKTSENITSHQKNVQHYFVSRNATNSSKFVVNKTNKSQIVAKSNANADSDKENDEENNISSKICFNVIIEVLKVNNSYAMSLAGKNKEKMTKVNQDTYFVYENIFGLSDYSIYGIMDGHGANGHFVSQFIQSEANEFFSIEELYKDKNCNSIVINAQMIQDNLEMKDYYLIHSFYKNVNKDLLNKKFDVHFSGSTCVIAFHIGNKLICANTGDSRAILIRDTCNSIGSNDYTVIPLSHDHKPESKEERKRIESLGGEVDQYETQGIKEGPYRVWVKGEQYPGIAISRTIGDEIAESVGVIYNPEVISYDLTVNDKYVVIASDGVWEFIENSKVMEIINPFYYRNDPEGACKAVIDESIKKWEKEDEVIDDISLVVIFLKNEQYKW